MPDIAIVQDIDQAEAMQGLARQINAAHASAENALRASLGHARTAGELLVQAKAQCKHGQWLPWLREHVRCSARTAQAYMRIASRWSELEAKAQAIAHLTFEDGLKLLAESNEPPETDEQLQQRQRLQPILDRAERDGRKEELVKLLANPLNALMLTRDASQESGFVLTQVGLVEFGSPSFEAYCDLAKFFKLARDEQAAREAGRPTFYSRLAAIDDKLKEATTVQELLALSDATDAILGECRTKDLERRNQLLSLVRSMKRDGIFKKFVTALSVDERKRFEAMIRDAEGMEDE